MDGCSLDTTGKDGRGDGRLLYKGNWPLLESHHRLGGTAEWPRPFLYLSYSQKSDCFIASGVYAREGLAFEERHNDAGCVLG